MSAGAEQVRHEAERLVAAAIATVSGLASGHRAGLATGSAECCVCPVCRVIAAVREPTPEVSERLATGIGDLATGIASMMRAFTARPPGSPAPTGGSRSGDEAESWSGDEDPWHAATTGTGAQNRTDTTAPSGAAPASKPASAPKPMAKKAVRKAPPPDVADARTPAENRPPDEGSEAGT